MNIILINHYAGSDKYGMEYRPFYLSREWVNLGHNVTIVAASFSHVRSRQPDLKGNNIYIEIIDGIRYVWLKTPHYKGNGLKRVINMLAFIWQLFRRRHMLLKNKPDVVIASSTYPLDIYPANYLAKPACAKLVFEVHDLWPLSPMELGKMSRWHPFIVVMQLAENFAYHTAQKVVSMLPKAVSHMVSHGMETHKFVHIPNGIDLSDWNESELERKLPPEHQTTIQQAKEANKFIVMYAGAHGLANALDTLIDAALILKDQPVQIIMIGQGSEKENLQQKVWDNSLNNTVFLPPVSKKNIPALLAQADALYIGLQKVSLFRFGISPNKLMDYMMAAKPIIQAIEAGNDLVAESGSGISISPENPQELAGAILEMLHKSPAEREQMGQNGRNYVINNHDYKILAQKFIEAVL